VSRRSTLVLMIVLATLVLTSLPVSAQSDTTPPQLSSLSVTPNHVDASSSEQTVTLSAVITDNLSGVCAQGDPSPCTSWSGVDLSSPHGQRVSGVLQRTSGDSYTTTLTFSQFAEEGIWADLVITLTDAAGNIARLDRSKLLAIGINAAIGVGSISPTVERSVTLTLRLSVGRTSVRIIADQESACSGQVPVRFEQKTPSGWNLVRSGITTPRGQYNFPLHEQGKYRAVAPASRIGTPTLTTCLKASRAASTG
jgi:hypothetical protein